MATASGSRTGPNNTILGNFIGVDQTGSLAVPNALDGIILDGATDSNIGGVGAPGTLSRNIISGNTGNGIQVVNSGGSRIQGNFIGVGADSTAALGNGAAGVAVVGSVGVTVGGTVANSGNIIANNAGDGVAVISGTAVRIQGNSIDANGGLGIDLTDDGPTLNDPNDPDVGANDLQNFPILNNVASGAGRTLIQGTLNSLPNTQYSLQFFTSPPPVDPSGFGEGRTLLGSATVTTDSAGNATINVTFTTPVSPGDLVAGTATDPAGNTSEFSPAAAVAPAANWQTWSSRSPTRGPGDRRGRPRPIR